MVLLHYFASAIKVYHIPSQVPCPVGLMTTSYVTPASGLARPLSGYTLLISNYGENLGWVGEAEGRRRGGGGSLATVS